MESFPFCAIVLNIIFLWRTHTALQPLTIELSLTPSAPRGVGLRYESREGIVWGLVGGEGGARRVPHNRSNVYKTLVTMPGFHLKIQE